MERVGIRFWARDGGSVDCYELVERREDGPSPAVYLKGCDGANDSKPDRISNVLRVAIFDPHLPHERESVEPAMILDSVDDDEFSYADITFNAVGQVASVDFGLSLLVHLLEKNGGGIHQIGLTLRLKGNGGLFGTDAKQELKMKWDWNVSPDEGQPTTFNASLSELAELISYRNPVKNNVGAKGINEFLPTALQSITDEKKKFQNLIRIWIGRSLAVPVESGQLNGKRYLYRIFFERPFDSRNPQLAVRQTQPASIWGTTVGKAGRSLPVAVSAERGTKNSEIFAYWRDIASSYHKALDRVVDASSLSFLPTLEPAEADKAGWTRLYLLRDLKGRSIGERDCYEQIGGTEYVPAEDVNATAHFPGIVDHDGNGVSGVPVSLTYDKPKRPAPPGGGPFQPEPGTEPVGGAQLKLKLSGIGNEDADVRLVRIGALDLELRDDDGPDGEALIKSLSLATSPDDESKTDISLKGTLHLSAVRAGGQDPLPDERRARLGRSDDADLSEEDRATEALFERESPLVIPLSDDVGQGSYLLRIEEQIERGFDRALRLELLDDGGGSVGSVGTGREVLVLDRAPFLVAEVEVPSFSADRSDGGSASLGNWELSDVEGQKWELSGFDDEDGFRLRLPPQAVGEEMEKGDHAYGAFREAPDKRPIGADKLFTGDNEYEMALDYRFSPPASFQLRSSYFEQRYVEAPWNLRRVLGYPGQRAPGAGVESLKFELLYGLAGEVQAPGLRLSDIEARMGAIPPRIPKQPDFAFDERETRDCNEKEAGEAEDGQQVEVPLAAQEAAYEEHWRRWARLTHMYRSRLAVLQPYAEGRRDHLRLEDGVRFRLRQTDAADPVDPDPGKYLLVDEGKSLSKTLPGRPSLKIGERSFHGGALWGFESRNILDTVLRWPETNSAELKQPAFSALGGFGWLKAAFDNDLTKVYADVALGRARFYSVERIGRIGNLWHRAKHVIVYERTVVPSRQFRAQQPRHEGRMVLRKTLEFVEILEPIRRYPDKGNGNRRRGPLLAAEFKSSTILVDGRWGRDIEGGWIIPLWQPQADPEVYPKPQIAFHLAADPDAGEEFVPGMLEEPDKLVFYTDTGDAGPDTDAWGPVSDVDYCDENDPQPDYIEDVNDIIDGEGEDRRLPDAAPFDGCIRFTYRIDTGGRQVNLVAERTEEPMKAVLETVTFMRASKAGEPTDANSKAIREIFAKQESGRTVNQLAEMFQQLSATATEFKDKLPDSGNIGDIKGQLDKLKGRVQESIAKRQAEIKSNLSKTGMLDEIKSNLNAQCESFQNIPQNLATQWQEGFETRVSEFRETVVRQTRNAISPTGGNLRDQVERLVEQTVSAVELATKPFSLGIEDTVGEIAALRRSIDGAVAEFKIKNAEALSSLETLLQDIERDIESDEIERIAAQLDLRIAESTKQIQRDVNAILYKINGTSTRAKATLDRASTGKYANAAAQIRKSIDSGISAINGHFSKLKTVLESIPRLQEPPKVDDWINKVRGWVGNIRETEADLASEYRSFEAGLADSLSTITKTIQGLELAGGDLTRQIGAWPEQLRGRMSLAVDEAFGEFGGEAERLPEELDKALQACLIEENFQFKQMPKPLPGLVPFIAEKITLLTGQISEPIKNLCGFADEKVGEIFDWLEKEAEEQAKKWVDQFRDKGKFEDLRKALEQEARSWRDSYQNLEDKLKIYGREITDSSVFQVANPALRIIRAFGEGPVLPQLKFNRERIAYFFDDAREAVQTSPMAAIVNDAGEALNAFGLRVPTDELLDRIIPKDLEKALLSKVTEALGGLKFANLFPDLKMPPIAKDAIQIRHGIDKQSQTAWLKAELDMPFAGGKVFTFGPLLLRLLRVRMRARAELETRLGGGPTHRTEGELWGDWELSIGGVNLVTFERTAVRYDQSGKFTFDVSADRIRLDRAIQWLSDLLAAFSDPDSGFILELDKDAGGRPTGVKATLDLKDITVGGGAFAVSSLSLGSFIRLGSTEVDGKSDFVIAVGANLGRRGAPFSLTIAFLKGGGWIDSRARYFPSTGKLGAAVSIAISAGAGADISLGWVTGSVAIEVALAVEFKTSGGGGQTMRLAIMLIIRGRVILVRIVSVSLTMVLSLVYEDNGSLIGYGHVSVSVKISRFWKVSVSKDVQHTIAKGKKRPPSQAGIAPLGAPYRSGVTEQQMGLTG